MDRSFDVMCVLSIGVVICLTGYVIGMWQYNFFSMKKVKFVPPYPFVGNIAPLLLKTRSFPDMVQDWYRKLRRHSFGGIYNFLSPIVILKDPHLIKRILVKDFEYFVNRPGIITEDVDPLLGNCLMSLKGKQWKEMRSVLDPTFSPKMLKHMVGLISKCGLQMTEHLSERSGDEILTLNMKEFFSRFVSDVIASCGFGMECDSFKQPDNIFYKMAKTVHNVASRPNMILWRNLVSPRLFQLLKVQRLPTKVHDYFKSLVYNTMKFREVEDIVRPDMIHLLMQMRGEVSGDEEETKIASEETEKRHETVDERLVAQAVLFILAGLDSSTTLLCWASHLLATHPDVQLRLSNEIETVLGEKNGKLTYEELGNMKYLDMVLSETLRLFPPTVMTERVCVKSYTINETGPDPSFVLPKGQVVWIPIFPLHRDPKHFSEPERFDPERFSDENKPRIKPFTYLPFGAGRRSCIGSDLAFLLAKVALVHLISSSTLHVVSKTKTRIRFDKDQLTLSNENGFWLGVEPKNKTSSKSSSNLR